MKIFTYGSNMHLARLRRRVESAVPVGVGFVQRRRFLFHKRGLDGSAKADAFFTGDVQDRVWGVVFEIAQAHKLLLDQYESVGVGYDDLQVDVQLDCGKSTSAVIYAARAELIDATLKPFCWYHRFVIDGARLHGLPAEYVAFLEQFQTVRDPDDERHAQNRRISLDASQL